MKRFVGGVHPPMHKDISQEKAIRKVLPGHELVYPLLQHIGVPAVPIVQAGDTVCMGQCIATTAEGRLSVPIFSSVSGTVKKIEPRLLISGRTETCIVVENDGQYALADGIGGERDPNTMSAEKILEAIEWAGIVGLGGAGFPTASKLRAARNRNIDYVLFNGAECEPYLTVDYRLMFEQTDKLIAGVKLWMRLFPRARAIIAVERDKPAAIARLRERTVGTDIGVAALRSRYPQGSERALIYAVTGRRLSTSVLPPEAGCIVQNIATVIAGYEAVCRTTPLMSRTMTLTGDAMKEPGNFEVLLGTDLQTVIDAAGGFAEEPEKVISGGPMTGTALVSLSVPVVKTTSAVIALQKDPVSERKTTACIRCGRCVSVCPVKLTPQKLVQYVKTEDLGMFEKSGGRECIACGACTYACPARIPLTQSFQYAKRELAFRRQKEEGK